MGRLRVWHFAIGWITDNPKLTNMAWHSLTHMASSNSKACDVKCHLHITRFMISCDELLCADWEADH